MANLLLWILLGQATSGEAHILKTFYLRDGTSSQQLTEIITALRRRLDFKFVMMNTGVTAVTVRETPSRVGQAETFLTQFGLRASSSAVAVTNSQTDEVHVVQTFYLDSTATQLNLLETVTALRTLLNMRYVATNRNANAIVLRDTQSQIALAAKVIADLDPSQSSDGVQSSAVIDAGKESEMGRRGSGGTERQISLRNVQTEQGISEIVTALRTLLSNAQVHASGNKIVLRDTENNLLVAERIIAHLDKPLRK